MTRFNYIQTDELIKETYLELIKAGKRMPTQEEVAEKCNLARKTVNVHLNRTKLIDLRKSYKALGDKVLLSLYIKAMKGDVQAIKLFLSLIFDYTEKQEVELTGKGGKELKIIFEMVEPKKQAKEQKEEEK